MIISQDRLANLKEQLDYLEQLRDFAHNRNAVRLGKQGASNESLDEIAKIETEHEFNRAGLGIAEERIRLEIDFLTDYFS